MPCYYPIEAVQPFPGAPLQLFARDQKHLRDKIHGRKLQVPCNQCSGCRKRQSLEWALRCTHEVQMHRYNCYLTLTYDDNNLPPNRSLRHSDYVAFMKATRNALSRGWIGLRADETLLPSALRLGGRNRQRLNIAAGEYGALPHTPIKFYMAGEYGELYGRPHYHAILFGMDFPDMLYHGKSKAGEKIYTSATLQRLWPHGYSSLGTATFASAAYISRYITKKRTGDGNKKDYEILDMETGEIIKRAKEYNCMSRASGIGKEWIHHYTSDVYTLDKVISKTGRALRPPRYYDKQYKRLDAAHLRHLKHARELEALAQQEHHTPERLAVQEIVQLRRDQALKRNFDF